MVHSPDTGVGMCNECSSIRGIFGEKVGWGLDPNCSWDVCFSLFWTPGIVRHFCIYTALLIGPNDFKVSLLTKFGSL
jgi:hypothetical protein